MEPTVKIKDNILEKQEIIVANNTKKAYIYLIRTSILTIHRKHH